MFAVVGQTSSFHGVHHGYSERLSFPPAFGHAQVALTTMLDHLHASETYAKTHIEEYTHRPLPDSADEAVSGLYLPIINAVERLTSLTWRIGADGLYVEARLDLLWWGDVSIATNAPKVVHVPPGLAVVVYDSVSGTILHVHEEADRTLLATSSSDARRATDERL